MGVLKLTEKQRARFLRAMEEPPEEEEEELVTPLDPALAERLSSLVKGQRGPAAPAAEEPAPIINLEARRQGRLPRPPKTAVEPARGRLWGRSAAAVAAVLVVISLSVWRRSPGDMVNYTLEIAARPQSLAAPLLGKPVAMEMMKIGQQERLDWTLRAERDPGREVVGRVFARELTGKAPGEVTALKGELSCQPASVCRLNASPAELGLAPGSWQLILVVGWRGELPDAAQLGARQNLPVSGPWRVYFQGVRVTG